MLKTIFYLAIIGLIITSCNSTNVVSNHFIQKRKYQSGYHFNFSKKKGSNDAEVLVKEDRIESKSIDVLNSNSKTISEIKGSGSIENDNLNNSVLKITDSKTINPVESKFTRNIQHKIGERKSLEKQNTQIKTGKKIKKVSKPKRDTGDMPRKRKIAIFIMLYYLPPLGVYKVRGKGRKFKISLFSFITFIAFAIWANINGGALLIILAILLYAFTVLFSWFAAFR